MSHDALYRNGLGGFPPIDAPSPIFGVRASRAPHSIQDGMSSFNATGLTENDNGPVLLNSQQISDYWPHLTNIWIRSTKPSLEDNGVVTEIYECRNRRRMEREGTDRGGTGSNYKGTYLTPEQVAARLQEQSNELPTQPVEPQTMMPQPPSTVPYEPRYNGAPAPLPLRNQLHSSLAPQQLGSSRSGQSAAATTAGAANPSAPGNSSNVRINASIPGVPMPHYQAEQLAPPRASLVSQPFPHVSHVTANASDAGL
ncbi:hypothetical protein Slin15195_G065160 [Septoria linicola]|uniref:Uncharacterized protein n=1 Tax=Septoria linicola TaxID=215465 RepID=A0A9Q9APA3_9PEZI|nr:hypothetical protein Slin14017_G115500 [Septoria linicola]USW53197.1 hypothetical protein Slin15195_G065160 [Septoria linicola]